jgi:hypothetical protein
MEHWIGDGACGAEGEEIMAWEVSREEIGSTAVASAVVLATFGGGSRAREGMRAGPMWR